MATKSFNQALTQTGGSDGTLTVANSSGFEVGAIVFLAAKDLRIRQLKVAAKPSATTVLVTDMADSAFDATAFTVAKEAKLFQPRSALLVPSDPAGVPLPSTVITRTTSISVPDGGTELILNADSGNALLIRKNGVDKLKIDANGNIFPVADEGVSLGDYGYAQNGRGGRFSAAYLASIRDADNYVRWSYGTNASLSSNTYRDASFSTTSSSVAHIFTTQFNYTAGKLASFRNQDTEKAFIDKDGVVSADSFVATTATGNTLTGGGASGPLVIASNTPNSYTGEFWFSTPTPHTPAIRLKALQEHSPGDLILGVEDSTGTTQFGVYQSGGIMARVRVATPEVVSGGALNIQGNGNELGVSIRAGNANATAIAQFVDSTNASKLAVNPNGDLVPATTNTSILGSSTRRWSNIHLHQITFADGTTQTTAGSGGGGGGASSLQEAYDGGDTITLTNGNDFQVNAPASGTAGILMNAKGVRSNLSVENERLDLRSTGARVGGLQVLVESTNTSGLGQVFIRGSSSSVLQAGADPYPFYVLVDSDNKAISIEANDAAGTIFIGGAAANSAISIGASGQRYITIGNGSGATTVDVNPGIGGFLVDPASSGPISLDALNAASNFTVSGANLTLSTVVSGNLILESAGSINMGAEATNQIIRIGTAGTRTVNVGSRTAPVMLGTAVPSGQNGAPMGYYLKSAGTNQFAATEIVRFDSNGNLARSDADAGGTVATNVIGVALDSDTASVARVATIYGTVVEMKFASAPAAGDEGKAVFLSTTAGAATLTQPGGGARAYRLGTLISSTVGPSGGYFVIFQPVNDPASFAG